MRHLRLLCHPLFMSTLSTPAACMYVVSQSCRCWNTSLEWVGAAMASAPATHSRDAGDDLYNDKVMLAAVISLSVVIFFVFFLHIYARWLIRRQRPVVRRVVVFREPLHLRSVATFPGHTTEIRLSISGVDPKVVASLPVFVYKSREHQHGLDCVVCLSAMEEDDCARLLPACKHAFHVGCIDTWLMSHATCPICRAPVEIMGEPAQVVDAVSVVVPVVVVVAAAECDAALQVEPRNANEESSCVVNVAAAEGDGSHENAYFLQLYCSWWPLCEPFVPEMKPIQHTSERIREIKKMTRLAHTLLQVRSEPSGRDGSAAIHAIKGLAGDGGMRLPEDIDHVLAIGFTAAARISYTGLRREPQFLLLFFQVPVET
ncbi:hypothetical protein BHE74_00016514 [Ensete ventricosum]|nr:hypothetical protein BHE74_00016514 [Ensete ventricosum]